mmetsp:Transcript_26567/g.45349  ORF Transcript_26567/g.45349 Transcript_26567/m.45349 type:complete len:413 (+) Transcript_26567:152-1390(+)
MTSSPVPPSLKKIKVFLTRATELDRDKSNPESRVVAYNCRQYAVLQGIPLASSPGADASAKTYLGELLGELEREKEAMAVFSKSEHWKICRKVSDRVFEKADGEDRGGVANKGTAKTFYAAGTFYEILQQFYDKEEEGVEMEEEVKERRKEEEQRRLYCKWKATDILNAVKEGRTPTRGGYQQETTEEEEEDVALPPAAAVGQPPVDDTGLPSITEEDLPSPPPPPAPLAAPPMPSSDFFDAGEDTANNNNTANNDAAMPPPPAYDGIELSLSGDPTPTTTPAVEDVNEGDEDSGTDEIYIPGSSSNTNTHFPTPMAPPPPYSDPLPPPAASTPLPPPPTSAPSSSNRTTATTTGMFSSLFSSNGTSNNKKLSKIEMADAVELTKFALAALQKGDGNLGRERLEQALGIWRR